MLVTPNRQNHWDSLHLWVSSLKCSLLLLSYRITELHHNYWNATFSADYVGYLYFQNHWVTPYIWVSTLRAAYVG